MPGFIFSSLTYVDCKKYAGRTPACDLKLVSSTGPNQLGSRCWADPNCKAFLTNGWLKSASAARWARSLLRHTAPAWHHSQLVTLASLLAVRPISRTMEHLGQQPL